MATTEVQTLDGSGRFNMFIAEPAGQPLASIIVIQEIFGINEGIKRRCERWADFGYLAIAPDLFWRIEPGVDLDPDIPEQFQQALDLMGKFDQDQGVQDIEATIRAARERLPVGGKVGCVGYCLGGRLAFMTAARTDVDASVGYYGIAIDKLLHEKFAIAKPLMLHIAEADHFVTPDIQKAMHDGLDDHPKVVLHDYPGVDHGFATEMGKRRSEEAAQLADKRTEAFFAKALA